MMRTAAVSAGVCLSLIGLCAADGAKAAADRIQTDIPPEALGAALKEFAQNRDMQVLYFSAAVKDLRTGGAWGELTADETLDRLLSGTGLTYRYVGSNAVTILPAPGGSDIAARPAQTGGTPATSAAREKAKEGKTSSSGSFRVARGAPAAAAGAAAVTADSRRNPAVLEEVVVTAEKRQERLQDVPVPVSAISADRLAESNQTRLQDYYSTVPGLTLSPGGSATNSQTLVIRGISSGFATNPTVGITVDDVPFGSSTSFTGNQAIDFDPSDLARIEVLRGPQGTLYGASSMGGVIKYVTVDPSVGRLYGRVQADLSAVHNGAEAGYAFRGAVNVPVTGSFAIGASAFARQDPGYIDNPVSGVRGINEDHVTGGRLAGMWSVSPTTSLKLSALYQEVRAHGLSDVDLPVNGYAGPPLGDLQQNYVVGLGGYEKRFEAYSAIIKSRVGRVGLTSLTGYNVLKLDSPFDYSGVVGGLAKKLFGVTGAPVFTHATTDKFSQELRAAVPIGERIDWLIGGFYTHEKSPFEQDLYAQDPLTGATLGNLGFVRTPTTYAEYALFTNLTVHFTDRFDVQFGGRGSHIEQVAAEVIEGGPLFGGSKALSAISTTANPFTYLLTPRFRISPHTMIYARIASGYRAGVSNSFNPDPTVPRVSSPDKTKNYEVGLKGDLLDRALTFDTSVYYIDWKAIQINLLDPANKLTYISNGSRAKSEGVELSLHVVPLPGLTISPWVTYSDTVLTEGMPPNSAAYGPAGSRLPYSTRWSGSISIRDDHPLTGDLIGFGEATASYVGDRLGTFVTTPARAYYPAYTKLDLSAGVTYDAWTLSIYANNVTDRRGLIGGGAGTYPPFAFLYIQPRTIGMSIVRSF